MRSRSCCTKARVPGELIPGKGYFRKGLIGDEGIENEVIVFRTFFRGDIVK